MSDIRFGVRIPNSSPLANGPNLIRAATEAERIGFDSVWVHDHLTWTREIAGIHLSSGAVELVEPGQTPDFYDSIVALSYVAARTERTKLGVAVLVLPGRDPVYIAKQWAVLDALSGGRTILGVGLGSPSALRSGEFDATPAPRKQRAQRMDEYIRLLRAIWTEPEITFDGEFVKLEGAEIFPKPVQRPHPPILVGGTTEYAARRAGRLGDGWIPAWLTPDELRHYIDICHDEAAQHGRTLDDFEIGLEIVLSVAPDRETAHRRGEPTVTAGLSIFEKKFQTAEAAIERSLFGTPEDVREQVRTFADAGVTHFKLRPVYTSVDHLVEQMELFAEHVFPDYRDD